MKKAFLIFLVAIIPIWALFYTNLNSAYSVELDDINEEMAELQEALDLSKKATVPLESQVNNLTTRLNNIDARVGAIEADIKTKRENISKGYLELGEQQLSFNLIVKNSYIKTYSLSPLLLFFSSTDPAEFIKFLTYQQRDAERDKSTIISTALKLIDLEKRKKVLEGEEKTLANIKSTLDSERAEIEKIVQGAKEYQSDLSGQIAVLSARQNEIINARSGGFTATIGDSNLADDINASIQGFRDSAPSGYFAAFSFGAHTHRKGMSQYGARGRAISGQGPEEILSAYYPSFALKKDYDSNAQVNVQGHGIFNIEDYVKRIYEVPASWTENNSAVLKAQAVAARTYALDSMRRNGSICTTEACQVFKPEPKGGAWEQAVNDTTGWVLMNGDDPAFTQYASTHGGFTDTSGWDTTDGNGGGDFINKAYDKIGGSPWLYKAWYTKAYSVSSDKCGRSNAWLSPEEMADIVNAAIALKTGGIDTDRITPITTSCWGGNPYSMDELRNLVSGNGGISSATSVSVSQGNGLTNTVVINGVSMSGDEFKKAFNLRAPGYLSIPQSSFAFFNVEKK